MLIDNKQLLQLKNKQLLEKLNRYEMTNCEVVPSKSGDLTMSILKDGQKISFHSRYNPVQEAQQILEKQLSNDTKYVLLVGVGLGYIVKRLNEVYPNIKFSIFEPNLDVLKACVENFDLSKLRTKNLDFIFSHISELQSVEKLFLKLAEDKSEIIITPIAQKLYATEINQFISSLKNFLASRKSSVITDLRFQMRWTMNSIVNFEEVLNSPNFFKHVDLDKLTNKPAIIVAAGPSLNDEIENLREIKNKGKAYIFAVGSAVNTLIKHNIMPDALFSYDPTAKNAEVVKLVKEQQLPIPLIFGSSIGFEVLRDYPGKKIHFFTSQDSFNTNIIPHECNVIIPDAPTIAAIAMYIAGGINMSPIVLVGQNLGITKEKAYASGINYVDTAVTEETLRNYKPVMSTTNEEIYTQDGYLEMRDILQHYIVITGAEGKVFNTTKNGLPIAGAPYIPLSEVMETNLMTDNVVDSGVFNIESEYNQEEALKNYKQLEKSFDSLVEDFKKVIEIDKEIQEAFKKKIISNLQNYLNEFDKYFGKIEKNPFFLRIIGPTTRSQYKELIDKAENVRFEKRPLQKMEKFIETYSKYIRTMYVAIYEIQPAFAELKKSDLFKKEDSQ